MPEPPDEVQFSQTLRDGLCALPIPETAPDFDSRILAALLSPQPWWQRLWQPAKPLLLGASCSLAMTLLALHWTLSAPQPPFLGEPERPLAAAWVHAPSLDALLNRPNLSAGSLSAWARPTATSFEDRGQNYAPGPHLGPRRRAQRLRCRVIV